MCICWQSDCPEVQWAQFTVPWLSYTLQQQRGATYPDCPTHYSNREEQCTLTDLYITATVGSNVPWLSTDNTVTRGAMYHDYPRHYSNREEQHTMTVLHITATERSNVPWLSTENTVWPEEQRTMTILDIKVTERSNVPKWVSNLLFYAQSTIMVISGCQRTKTVHRQYSMTRGAMYHDCPQRIQCDQRSNVPWLS